MAQEPSDPDLMDYPALARQALRDVVRLALDRVAREGLPGNHHFYISFRTDWPGVQVPGELKSKFPEEMTIVIQHQFSDLLIEPSHFSVTLRFGGQPRNLSIPFAAITQFLDPSIQFHLAFDPSPGFEDPLTDTGETGPVAAEPSVEPVDPDKPNVVSLDQFRKK